MDGTALAPAAAAWVSRALPQHRITGAETLGGGYRNENIRVVTDRGSYVLRRYRRGGAGAAIAERTCAVEAALAARLAAAAVPIAEVIAADPAGAA
ncbi:MAG TPA: phosphotransferase, partial [Streptosporangiaceae bacterium]|nr:phosphotransferase [Streptosporangiaceae bacterium]